MFSELHESIELAIGPNIPDLDAPEPVSMAAEGCEETLSDVEDDVRDYDLGEGD